MSSPRYSKLEFYLVALFNYLVAAIPWAYALDWVTKVVTLLIAGLGFWYMRKRHFQDMKNKMLEEQVSRTKLENLQQEQYQLLAKNKLLNTINKQTEERTE